MKKPPPSRFDYYLAYAILSVGIGAVCVFMTRAIYSFYVTTLQFEAFGRGLGEGIGRGVGEIFVSFAEVLPQLVFWNWIAQIFGWVFGTVELSPPLLQAVSTKAAPFFEPFNHLFG